MVDGPMDETKCAVALQVAGVSAVKSAVYRTFINYVLLLVVVVMKLN